MPIFTEPTGPKYYRDISTFDHLTHDPLLPDPYESVVIEVRKSKVSGAGEGLFAKVKLESNVVLAFYNGKRIKPRSWEDQDFADWTKNAYKIFDPANKTGGRRSLLPYFLY